MAPETMFLIHLLLQWSRSPWTLIKSDATLTLALSGGLKETLPWRPILLLVYTPFYQTSRCPLVQMQANSGSVNDIDVSLGLICSVCHNKITQTGWLNRKVVSDSLGARSPRPQRQQGWCLVSLRCRWCRLMCAHLAFPLCVHVRKERMSSLVCPLIRTLIPIEQRPNLMTSFNHTV